MANETAGVTEYKSAIESLFDRAAPTYDLVGPHLFSHLGRQLVDFGSISPESRILDIACGRGSTMFAAVERLGPNGHVSAIDISPEMVRLLAHDIRERCIRIAKAHVMDAEYLAFADHQFDVVICGFGIFFFPNWHRALAECARVLLHGGKLLLSTWCRPDARRRWFVETMERFLGSPDRTKQALHLLPRGFDQESDLHDKLLNAGFSDVHTVVKTLECTYETAEQWWNAQWSHGSRAPLEYIESTMGTDGLNEFKGMVFEHLKSSSSDGRFSQQLTALFASAETS